jgi:uncharacterized protein
METAGTVRERVSLALRESLRARDGVASAALRSALGAIGNAEAVSVDAIPAAGASSAHLAGAAAGLRAADVPRRVLSEEQVAAIVRAEITDREESAEQYASAGHADRAELLRSQARVLEAQLAGGTASSEWVS